MATSMTGFGRGEAIDTDRRITVEIKSINNRYCDIQIRIPRVLASLENRVREEIGRQVSRGKIDVFINFEDNSPDSSRVKCDVGLARAYAAALREIAGAAEVPDALNAGVLGRFNDVLQVESAQIDPDAAWLLLQKALQSALASLNQMRRVEGGRLAQDLLQRNDLLESLRLKVEQRAPLVVADYRQRLVNRIDELLGERSAELFDQQRLAAEVALFADKCSIDEELVRLCSHLRQLTAILQTDEAVGKKLDFLVQEINREINTIGSKANDLELINQVVAMKSELEKIREQIQNLE